MSLRTIDPKKVIITIGGVPMTGYADGEFVSIERSSDAFEKATGADGITSRVKLNDSSGEMTLTLAQTSPSNDVLTAFAVADDLTGSGVVPVSVTDLSGRTVVASALGWIKKLPTVSFDKSVGNREWKLDLADLVMFVGGNTDFSFASF